MITFSEKFERNNDAVAGNGGIFRLKRDQKR
jgi:hypothetical protein